MTDWEIEWKCLQWGIIKPKGLEMNKKSKVPVVFEVTVSHATGAINQNFSVRLFFYIIMSPTVAVFTFWNASCYVHVGFLGYQWLCQQVCKFNALSENHLSANNYCQTWQKSYKKLMRQYLTNATPYPLILTMVVCWGVFTVQLCLYFVPNESSGTDVARHIDAPSVNAMTCSRWMCKILMWPSNTTSVTECTKIAVLNNRERSK